MVYWKPYQQSKIRFLGRPNFYHHVKCCCPKYINVSNFLGEPKNYWSKNMSEINKKN